MKTKSSSSELLTIIVMGVSGSGKTTIGKALALSLNWEFVEGDDFHPAENVEKMKNNIPLDDNDRWPWLRRLNDTLKQSQSSGNHTVVSCSALKKSYREALVNNLKSVEFVYLCGDRDLLEERMKARNNHFMKADMLKSQLATLEVPENALTVSIELSIGDQVNFIRQHFNL